MRNAAEVVPSVRCAGTRSPVRPPCLSPVAAAAARPRVAAATGCARPCAVRPAFPRCGGRPPPLPAPNTIGGAALAAPALRSPPMSKSSGDSGRPGAAVRGADGGAATAAAHERGPPAGGCRSAAPLTAPTSAGAACGGFAAAAAALHRRRRLRCAARRVVLLLPAGGAPPAGSTGSAFAVTPGSRCATPEGKARQRATSRWKKPACCTAAASASSRAAAEVGSLCLRCAALTPPRQTVATQRNAAAAAAAASTALCNSFGTPARLPLRCFAMLLLQQQTRTSSVRTAERREWAPRTVTHSPEQLAHERQHARTPPTPSFPTAVPRCCSTAARPRPPPRGRRACAGSAARAPARAPRARALKPRRPGPHRGPLASRSPGRQGYTSPLHIPPANCCARAPAGPRG
jgi:hypothetical protein